MLDQPTQLPEMFYGYRFVITESRSDGTYHDSYRVRLEILLPRTQEVLHVVERETRSTHQLSKRYRPAGSARDEAVTAAQRWVLEHRPDAQAARAAERDAAEARNRDWCREQFEAVGGDVAAYVGRLPDTLSTTEVGRLLGLGSARKLNPLLLEWGLQREVGHREYAPADPALGEQVGMYGTLRWETAALKVIWDAAVTHGVAGGGDAEFARRLRAHSDWFRFESATGGTPDGVSDA